MPFSSLLGNDRIKKLLTRAVSERRIGQGLILAGPRGVGKYQFALALAQAVNCDGALNGDACGNCLQCRKIAAGEHADVQVTTPDGTFIKIAQTRVMSREAQYRPFEGRRRVLIVDEAERMREEAANSILKTLEEPPDTSLILLVTSKPYALLETIRSRCQILTFGPIPVEEIEAHLLKAGRTGSDARLIAQLARGSVGSALEIDLGRYREKRRVLLELAEALTLKRDTVRLINAAEYLGRKLDRPEFEESIGVLMVILEDVFHLKLGEPKENIVNTDAADRLAPIAEAMTLDQIMNLAERLEQLCQDLIRNVNRQLAMEAVLLTGS